MTTLYETDLTDLHELHFRDPVAEIVTWQGHRALQLDGLAVIPNLSVADVSVEVQIGAEGAAYPGVAFRVADVLNHELAYAQPHTGGRWDALQYDPVFHGSNTWQLYHGEGCQKAVEVPLGSWFKFRVDFKDDRATVSVNDQAPLVVNRLARPRGAGLLGIWTFRPAYFRDLRISECASLALPVGDAQTPPSELPQGTVVEWYLEDFGVVECEPSGILNLNRNLSTTVGTARLTRQFEVESGGPVELLFGFSDELSLEMDGQVIFAGQHTFKSAPDWAERGYVAPENHVRCVLDPGVHRLAATLKVSEYFGWGLVLALRGDGVRFLPAALG